MAPEGSLSRSQESTTGPYPETDEYMLPTYKIEAVIIVLNEGITMCLEIKYYNISVRQHNLIIYL